MGMVMISYKVVEMIKRVKESQIKIPQEIGYSIWCLLLKKR
jgi:hypothetical protein